MPPPEDGYGPVNRGFPATDPFAAFDNRIRYNDMIRQQMITQYQQNVVRPVSMTLGQQRRVATDPRYQYGVPGGQDPRFYQRQAELNRMGYAGAVAKAAAGIAGWQAGYAIGGTLGQTLIPIPGIGFATGMAGTWLAGKIVGGGINNAIARQQFMQSMSADIETYRDQLGFNNLSYQQASTLGRNLTRTMFRGGFFGPQEQQRIHKIALSNRMISARGGGDPGSLRQYERNFTELKETTQEVVQLLQTTIEGGMSVIKELQQTGFPTMRAVRQQIRQAKAFGGITGLGAQNVMQIGAAGARAVQGTPWEAGVGASMYQRGAATAAYLGQMGPAQAYAVRRAGGVAAAGGALARFQMNVLQSGMGTKAAAYMMKPDGTIDEDRLQRMLAGGATGYQITQGAAQRGYAMGISGRVQFGRFKEDLFNQLTDVQRIGVTQNLFEAWRGGRAGNLEAQAWVFAGQYATDPREQRVIWQSLMQPKGYDVQYAAGAAQEAGLRAPARRGVRWGPTARFAGAVGQAIAGGTGRFFDELVGGGGRGFARFAEGMRGIGRGLGYAAEWGLKGVGIIDPRGGFNRASYADPTAAVREMYGIGTMASRAGIEALNRMAPGTARRLRNVQRVDLGIDFGGWAATRTREDINYLYRQMGTAQWGGTAGNIWKDPEIIRILGKSTNENVDVAGLLRTKPIATINAVLSGINQWRAGVNKKYEGVTTEWDRTMAKLPKANQEIMLERKFRAKNLILSMGDLSWSEKLGKLKAQGLATGAANDLMLKKTRSEIETEKAELGQTYHKMSIDMEKYRKATREKIWGAFGFEEEWRPGGGFARPTVATAATMRQLRGALGQGYSFETREAAEESFKEIQRLRGQGIGETTQKQLAKISRAFKPALRKVSEREAAGWLYTMEYTERFGEAMEATSKEQAARALKLRESAAFRFIDNLQTGLRQKVTSKQAEFISGVMEGALRPEDIVARLKGEGGAELTRLMARGAGVTRGVIAEWAAKPGALGMQLRGKAAAKAKEEVTGIDKAREDVLRFRQEDKEAREVVAGWMPWGRAKAQAKVEETEVALFKAESELRIKELTAAARYPTSDRDPGTYVNVQPPILNYWNNKWAFA